MHPVWCRIAASKAEEAIRQIEDGLTLFQLEDVQANRLMVCGKCPRSGIDPQRAATATRRAMKQLADKVSRFDEWGPDDEVREIRRREWGRDYRRRHHTKLTARDRDRRAQARINHLRRQLEGDDG